jgi:hypothetical protein
MRLPLGEVLVNASENAAFMSFATRYAGEIGLSQYLIVLSYCMQEHLYCVTIDFVQFTPRGQLRSPHHSTFPKLSITMAFGTGSATPALITLCDWPLDPGEGRALALCINK